MAITERTLGDHPQVAASLNNVAVLYKKLGEYGEAASAQERAVAILENVSGGKHPHLAKYLINLADLRLFQGRFGDAESLHRRGLDILEAEVVPEKRTGG